MGHREDLLAAARRCLEERGYAHTTARDLVAASGTNLASIGYHFGSKEALLTTAMSESFREWAERIRALALAAEPSSDPMHLLVASWGAILTSCAEYRGLAVAFTEAMAQAERQPELRAELADMYARSRGRIARMITELVSDVTVSQASTLAAFQIAVCDGLVLQWLLNPDETPSSAELVDAFSAVLRPRESGISAP
jgi:AcrR family transcriptional regulator